MPRERIQSLDTETVSKILGAAVSEFAAKPFEEASFNHVIKGAGISKGMMYYYFKSKEDVFSAVLQSSVRRLQSQLIHVDQLHNPAQFWIELERMIRAFIEFSELYKDVSLFLLKVFQDPDGHVLPVVQSYYSRLWAWAASFVARGQILGAVRQDLKSEWLIKTLWVSTVYVLLSARRAHWSRDKTERRLLDLCQRIAEP